MRAFGVWGEFGGYPCESSVMGRRDTFTSPWNAEITPPGTLDYGGMREPERRPNMRGHAWGRGPARGLVVVLGLDRVNRGGGVAHE